MKTYIGIDNGLDGAIAINREGQVDFHIMPVIKLGKGRKVDVIVVHDLLASIIGDKMVVVERPAGSISVKPAVSMADSFARIESCLMFLRIQYRDVTASEWQKYFWTRPNMPVGTKFDTKAAALNAAKKIWPASDWRKSDRARNAHDGAVDAALMSEWARVRNL